MQLRAGITETLEGKMTGTRVATHADTKKIVSFLKNYHETDSNLSDIPFDRFSMMQCVDYYIGMAKHVCFVYEKDNEITGVLMGSVEPFMFNKKRSWATDILNVAIQGGGWLMKRWISWCKMQKVDRIVMGVSTGDERTDNLYRVMGLERTGGMYMLNTREARGA